MDRRPSISEPIQVIYEPERKDRIAVDLVAVHGLHGNSRITWTKEDRGQPPCMWLRDLLPRHIPNSRIMTFDFNTSGSGNHGLLTSQDFSDAADSLFTQLLGRRVSWNPVVFLAHDIGGLVVMQALLIARKEKQLHSLFANVPKLVFFGTPHRAKDIASWDDTIWRLFVASNTSLNTPHLLPRLRLVCKVLRQVTTDFRNYIVDHSLVSIFQDANTANPVVDYFSATTDFLHEVKIRREGSHQNLCKFSTSDEPFRAIVNAIRIEANQDLIKCLAMLRSLAPPFRMSPDEPKELGDIQDVKEFSSCLTSERSSAVYLHANPGTGKGVFGSTLFRTQQNLSSKRGHAFVAYYSFSARDLQRTSTTSLLCSLIYQILAADVSKFPQIQDHYSAIQELSLWTSAALWVLLLSLLASQKFTSFLCIVNGVHNWDSSSAPFLRLLVKYLKYNPLQVRMKFVFIGELRENLRSLIEPYSTVELDGHAFSSSLARTYADTMIEQLVEDKPFLLALGFKEKLEQKLHACEDLVRLSVTIEILKQGIRSGTLPNKIGIVEVEPKGLVKDPPDSKLASIVSGSTIDRCEEPLYTPKSFREELELLPYDMSSLVAARFDSLPDWATKALSWILYAQRPMKLGELAVAMALVEDEAAVRLDEDERFLGLSEDLGRAFGPLLEVHGHHVFLRHEQVKESFLQIIRDNQKKVHDVQLPQSDKKKRQLLDHWSITRILLKYLVSKEFQEGAEQALSGALWVGPHKPVLEIAEYAALFWPAHYRIATEQSPHAEELLKLLPTGPAFEVWRKTYCLFKGKELTRDISDPDPLFFASQVGFSDVVDICLTSRSVEDRAQAILYASWAGHLSIVETLAQSEEMREAPSKQIVQHLLKAVATASRRGFEDIVAFLLKYLTETKVSFELDPILLCQAAALGYNQLVTLFLKNGAAVDATFDGATPLQLASKNGHESIVGHLLSCGADANSGDASDRCKPMLYAAGKGHLHIAELLLSHADFDLLDSHGRTALHLAASNGHEEVVNLLMRRASALPSLLQVTAKGGRTALHLAAQNGHNNITLSLVNAWKDGINAKDDKDNTPLRLASEGGHSVVVKMLLQDGAKVDDVGDDHHTSLYTAVAKGYEDIARMILEHPLERVPFPDIQDVLRETAKFGFNRVCQLCIQHMFRVHKMHAEALDSPDLKTGRTALHHAAESGHDKIIGHLLDQGANAGVEDNRWSSPLQLAAFANKWKAVESLLSRRNSPDTSGIAVKDQDLLRDLAEYRVPDSSIADHLKTITSFLAFGVDPNVPDRNSTDRKTALHCAAEAGNVGVIELLLKYKADPKAKSRCGWTPLFSAVLSNNAEAVRLLLEHGGGGLALDDDGWTPLHLAARYGKDKVIEALLDADKAALEYKTTSGNTPLHLAYDEVDAASELLRLKANINAQNKVGVTTLMKAAKYGHRIVVTLLLSREPKANLRLVNDSQETAAHLAALNDRFSIVQELLDQDDTIADYQDNQGRSVLHIAVKSSFGDTSLLLEPIPGKEKPRFNLDLQDKEGNTPLLLAVEEGQKQIVELLLRLGVDTEVRNKRGDTALLRAIKLGNEEVWTALLSTEKRANINAGDDVHPTALHYLAFEGGLKTIKKLVEHHEADVNARGGLYDTPLQAAATGGFRQTVRYLLDNGADPTLTGGIFGHALSAAAFSGLSQYVDELVGKEWKGKNVAVDYRDVQGRTVLHMAAWRGDPDAFKALRNAHASTNLTDHQGRSVMHHAAIGGSTVMLEYLLGDCKMSKLDEKDKDGWMPLHWACRSEANYDAVRRLTEKSEISWPQSATSQGWTPENIAAVHMVSGLIPEEKCTEKWKAGYCHWAYTCDGCQQEPIYGIRWRCKVCISFDFCFKCAWSRRDTHPHQEFETLPAGEGSETRPVSEAEEVQTEFKPKEEKATKPTSD